MTGTIAVYTLGCRANQFDSESIAAQFEAEGWHRVPSSGQADVHLINTCTVTNKGSNKSKQLIRKLLRIKGGKIVVTGCCAQEDAESIAKLGAHLVVDNRHKDNLYQLFRENPQGGVISGDITKETKLSYKFISNFGAKTRAHLKIQDGCNCRCTYCIIPSVRGNSRSLSPALVTDQARRLIEAGYKELVLTGIHLGQYKSENQGFEYILRQLLELEGDFRIRLSAVEPKEVSKSLLPLFSDYPDKLCRHLHVAIQSASTPVLKGMKRPYSREFLNDLFSKIHAIDSAFGMGIDVIVGFPGETEAMFLETKQFLEQAPIFYGHVFPFSPKIGTSAAKFPSQISNEQKKERSEILRSIIRKKQHAFLKSQTGSIQQALFESAKTGHCGNYIRVSALGKIPGEGVMKKVKLTEDISIGSGDKFSTIKAEILDM